MYSLVQGFIVWTTKKTNYLDIGINNTNMKMFSRRKMDSQGAT